MIILSVYYFIRMHNVTADFMGNMDEKSMMIFLRKAEIVKLAIYSTAVLNFGGMVLIGSVREEIEGEKEIF